ncbi:MAG: hypothetical protein K5675_02020 [Lachnospiraceae bacterium]|nr:hypothetical protein [Lachnospiraceae bacterium]
MKQILEEYGDFFIDAIAVVLVMGILTVCFFADQGVFPAHIINAMEPIL